MKKSYIIANWKSNKTIHQASMWLEEFKMQNLGLQIFEKEIIVCPSFSLLSDMKSYIINHALPIKLGGQDISPFEHGAYTGAVNGEQIKEFADYVLIGHSERRKYFHEDSTLLEKKVKQARQYSLTPIYCVSDPREHIPEGVTIVAYEPIFAIGSGKPDTPQNVESAAQAIFKSNQEIAVLYGGSVTAQNVSDFIKMPSISGVLVGKASLNPLDLIQIIHHA